MLFQCRTSVEDVGPTLKQYWVNGTCLLGCFPGLGGLKETKMFLPHSRVKVSIVESHHGREVACSASDRQGSNFESCVWRAVSSQSSHHPQEVLLAQFSLYVHKGGLKLDSFHFICWGAVAQYTADPVLGVVLGQRRRQFVGIEPAMGCDSSPTLNRN